MRALLSLVGSIFGIPNCRAAGRGFVPVASAAICAVALVVVATDGTGGSADAGPFFLRGRCRGPSCSPATTADPGLPLEASPPVIGPSPGSKEEEVPVPQPWLLTSEAGDTSSQQPDTVLDPVPGTGSRLGIGGKAPPKIDVKMDPALLDSLKKLLTATQQPTQPVPISLPVEAETSQRLSRLLMILEWLAWLGLGMGGGSLAGKLGPLVARLAAGLPSVTPAPSPPPQPTPAAASSDPARK